MPTVELDLEVQRAAFSCANADLTYIARPVRTQAFNGCVSAEVSDGNLSDAGYHKTNVFIIGFALSLHEQEMGYLLQWYR